MLKRRFSKMPYVALDEMILKQICKMSSRFANPTFLRCLKSILQRCFQGVFYHCLEKHLAKMFKNCLCEMSYIPLYEMSFRQLCKISSRFANPTSFRRLKDILNISKLHVWSHHTIDISMYPVRALICFSNIGKNYYCRGLKHRGYAFGEWRFFDEY